MTDSAHSTTSAGEQIQTPGSRCNREHPPGGDPAAKCVACGHLAVQHIYHPGAPYGADWTGCEWRGCGCPCFVVGSA